ncbi:hypothetical protein GO684_00295 [Wolbachia endosymbiont of Litomosoides brasiliensis]|uniref:hypothetical protein n=1 Tax=Wolbachia endosymbiont of Litomosoides brasiliensis TaxID=1812117 RepID=UPI00158E3F7E|nr:hypothetical protein [Wolbachia endosymbiont of Litomosoides brasiliensis]NUY39194.1 hypothetical protein [Wolbachia endosymbiont of Litomosoides brasiliensis]
MRIGHSGRFGLNVSKSTLHRNVQKIKFSYIMSRQFIMSKVKVDRKSFKKPNETIW